MEKSTIYSCMCAGRQERFNCGMHKLRIMPLYEVGYRDKGGKKLDLSYLSDEGIQWVCL